MSDPIQLQLLADFDRVQEIYKSFTVELENLIKRILKTNNLNVHSVTSRPKERSSLSEKVMREGKSYSSLDQITDLTGLRIITYFEEDVKSVADVVEREFSIDATNLADKRARLEADRFGYLSIHYVASLSDNRCALPEYKPYHNLKAEIQIRSILQHAWAEIEHDLGYKTEAGVPEPVRRRFARMAGLLEVADEQFNLIRQELIKYEANISEVIVESPETLGLDKITLANVAKRSDIIRLVDQGIEALIKTVRLDVVPKDIYESYANWLKVIGVTSVFELNSKFCDRSDDILSFAKNFVKTSPYPMYDGLSIGLYVYMIMAETLELAQIVAFLEHYADFPHSVAPKTAAAIIDAYKQSGIVKRL